MYILTINEKITDIDDDIFTSEDENGKTFFIVKTINEKIYNIYPEQIIRIGYSIYGY